MDTNSFVIEQPSVFDFDTTVDRIVKEAESRDWKVPAIHDLQLSLAKAGKTVLPVKVIEICKPAYSGQILELNDERLMSVMMPCRISVYLKADGLTYTAIINEAGMSAGIDGVASVVGAKTGGCGNADGRGGWGAADVGCAGTGVGCAAGRGGNEESGCCGDRGAADTAPDGLVSC